MPDSSLSEAIREAYASAPAEQVILHTLGLTHPDWSAPVYLVRDHQDFTARLEDGKEVTFTAAAFDFSIPDVKQTSVPQIEVRLDNVTGHLIPFIDEAARSSTPTTMTYRPYLVADPEGPQTSPPLELILSRIQIDTTTLTATAILTDMGKRTFPGREYRLADFPALSNV